jgi:hypothetical protein
MAQRFALFLGIVLALVGLLGFSVTGLSFDPDATYTLFGLFPTNVTRNLLLVFAGVWGVLASRSLSATAAYGTVAGVMFLGLGLLGYAYPTTFAYLPNGGYDVWFDLAAALLLLVLAVAATARKNALAQGYAVGLADAAPAARVHRGTAADPLADLRPARDEPRRLIDDGRP